MPIRILAIVLAALFSGTVAADAFDINLGDDSIQLAYIAETRDAETSLGYVDNDERNSWIASAGLLVTDVNVRGGPRTEVGLGGKLYVVSIGNQDVYALGLGGQLRVFPTDGPFAISGYAYYAPDIVTAGDGEAFWEAGARAELEVIRDKATVYVGYARARTDLKNIGDVTVDSGVRIGMQLNF